MIDVKDLRIGNYVKYNGFTCVVHSIKQKESRDDNFNDKDFVLLALDGIIGVTINNVEPIPLTEQWLIDFDFIRQGNRKMWVKGNVCVVLEDYPDLRGNSTGEKFYIGFKDLGNVIYHTQFEVPFVHTLQNAYALTGEELTKK